MAARLRLPAMRLHVAFKAGTAWKSAARHSPTAGYVARRLQWACHLVLFISQRAGPCFGAWLYLYLPGF